MNGREVTLRAATEVDAPVLANLIELYVHDLSRVFEVEIGADGRFGYPRLPLYWQEPDTHSASLVHVDGNLAGFALVTRGSPATADPDMAEFFILRRYRRSGVGHRAAFALWNQSPGRWVVRVAKIHAEGIAFWDRVIRAYTGGAFETGSHQGQRTAFHVYSFDSTGRRGE
jgi:predicted acetyltransferase